MPHRSEVLQAHTQVHSAEVLFRSLVVALTAFLSLVDLSDSVHGQLFGERWRRRFSGCPSWSCRAFPRY